MDWKAILTGVLDILTLFIVVASFLAIRNNREQTKNALEEGQRQSKAALALAREQIEESRKQSQKESSVLKKSLEDGQSSPPAVEVL